MNCWITLGIEEYSDKKTIKVAYAKLLKVTKPDDDPQGFKELHAAYKEALAAVSEYKESSSPQWFTPPSKNNKSEYLDEKLLQEVAHKSPSADDFVIDEDALDIETTGQTPPPISHRATTGEPHDEPFVTPPTVPYAEPTEKASPVSHLANNSEQEYLETDEFNAAQEQKKLEDDWDYLVSQTKHIIQTKAAQSTINDWQFIEQIPSMIDLEFRSQASDLVFEIISEINEISLEQKTLLVKEPILNYLNNLFHWNSKWKYYEEKYGDRVEAVFPFITEKSASQKKKNTYKRELFYYLRFAAYLLDITIVTVFIILINILFAINDSFLFSVGAIASYLLVITPLMEALPTLQASPGKLALGLKVVNNNGLCIPWYQSIWRAIATVFCIAGFKIVLWINLFLAYRKGILLQDSISNSFVVRKNK